MGKTNKDREVFLGRRGAEYSVGMRSRKAGPHDNKAQKREAQNLRKALRQGDWD